MFCGIICWLGPLGSTCCLMCEGLDTRWIQIPGAFQDLVHDLCL